MAQIFTQEDHNSFLSVQPLLCGSKNFITGCRETENKVFSKDIWPVTNWGELKDSQIQSIVCISAQISCLVCACVCWSRGNSVVIQFSRKVERLKYKFLTCNISFGYPWPNSAAPQNRTTCHEVRHGACKATDSSDLGPTEDRRQNQQHWLQAGVPVCIKY